MFHPDTQFLIDHWTGLARKADVRGGVPGRDAFAPEVLGARLPRTFLAERRGEDASLRLAGSWIETFADRTLAKESLLSLWTDASRDMVTAALTQAGREARPVVIVGSAGTTSTQVEVTLVPLRDLDERPYLLLGLIATGSPPVMDKSTRQIAARVTLGVGDHGRPALSLAAIQGRRIA
ncbi:hypothetical protein GCM10009101_14500 [Brevundimonas lenta]